MRLQVSLDELSKWNIQSSTLIHMNYSNLIIIRVVTFCLMAPSIWSCDINNVSWHWNEGKVSGHPRDVLEKHTFEIGATSPTGEWLNPWWPSAAILPYIYIYIYDVRHLDQQAYWQCNARELTSFIEIQTRVTNHLLNKMHFKMTSAKYWPFFRPRWLKQLTCWPGWNHKVVPPSLYKKLI